jgi:hypothetical protein
MDLPDYMETLFLLAAEIAIETDICVDIVCEIHAVGNDGA